MTTTTPPNLTVEVMSAERVHVAWTDAEAAYMFKATTNGNEIVEIMGSSARRSPTILRRLMIGAAGRGPTKGLSYLSASAPEHAEVLSAIKAEIKARKLITNARAAHAKRLAERAAEGIANKAKRMREILLPLLKARDERIALAGVQDVELADAYDRIQNSAV